jgi:hypothetical protein
VAFAKYLVLRFAVFAAVFALLVAVGVSNTWVAALIAILVSGAISLVLLDRVRDEAGRSLEAKGSPLTRLQRRVESATSAEDEADDAARAAREATTDNGLRSPEVPDGHPQDRTSD